MIMFLQAKERSWESFKGALLAWVQGLKQGSRTDTVSLGHLFPLQNTWLEPVGGAGVGGRPERSLSQAGRHRLARTCLEGRLCGEKASAAALLLAQWSSPPCTAGSLTKYLPGPCLRFSFKGG